MIWKNLKGVGDKQTGETDRVEDTKDPNEDKLCVAEAGLAGALVLTSHGSPENEGENHTRSRDEEETATTSTVDHEGSADGYNQAKEGVADVKTELLLLSSNTGLLVDQIGVVGDNSVTGVL